VDELIVEFIKDINRKIYKGIITQGAHSM